MFSAVEGRHVVILLTDGYDENSTTTYDDGDPRAAAPAGHRLRRRHRRGGRHLAQGRDAAAQHRHADGRPGLLPDPRGPAAQRARHRRRRRLPPLPAQLHAEEPGGRRHLPRHPPGHRRARSTGSGRARATSRPSRRRSSRRSSSARSTPSAGWPSLTAADLRRGRRRRRCRRWRRSRKRWRRSRSPW